MGALIDNMDPWIGAQSQNPGCHEIQLLTNILKL